MLGLNFDVELDVDKASFPVYFKNKNICIHCGATGSLAFVDCFGSISKRDSINAFDHIKCTKCGHSYSMKWEMDENGDMKPSAVELDIKRQFNNLLYSKTGNKSFQ